MIKTTREYANRDVQIKQKRGEAASSKTYSKMGKCYGNNKQRYADISRDRSQLTCLIHVPGHSLDEFKVLNDFGNNYSIGRYLNYS